jgi:carnitine-CoA ligase
VSSLPCESLAQIVSAQARTQPDRVALRIDRVDVTYLELDALASRVAAGLIARGVRRADVVSVMLPNCVEFVVVWLALNRIGAAVAAINIALVGDGLTHALTVSGASLLVFDSANSERVAEVLDQVPTLTTVIHRGQLTANLGGEPWSGLLDHEPVRECVQVAGHDPSIVLFTSGSTGRSKGCVLPHRYVVRQAEIFIAELGLQEDDVLFSPFPLFHADAAIFTVASAFVLGATAAIAPRFSVRRFWEQIRHSQATVFDFMGATLTMLHKQPPSAGDRENPVRLAWGVPLPTWAAAFEARFGVELVEVYGLSDAGIVLYNQPGQPRRHGSCGRPVEAFDVRILDPGGTELSPGGVGEICIRPNEPGLVLTEYLGMPQDTVAAFRDLWFHTGDLAFRDEDDYFYFTGRLKDMIRRRGENISALEIEEALDQHPAVLEVAAYGVPSDLTEEDVMVSIVLRQGHHLSADEVWKHCTRALAKHMVPRYVDFVADLPRTPTEKIEKQVLRSAGVSPSAHDRERPFERSFKEETR